MNIIKIVIRYNDNDFFPTYHALTRVLLDKLKFNSGTVFYEPAAGAGDITRIIREYYPDNIIYQSDLYPRAEGIDKIDFLNEKEIYEYIKRQLKYPPHVIITNPPFNLWMEFFKMAAKIVQKNIIFLNPLDYLHGVNRFETIYKDGYFGFYLKTCYCFERRPLFDKRFKPDGLMPTGAASFAWFNFEDYIGKPKIEWLEINKYMGVPTHRDQLNLYE